MGDTIRYEVEFLIHLKDSPLCVKPKDLPPKEDYMGIPAETVRAPAKTTTDRFKTEGSLLEQGSRRPGVDRHGSRSGTSDGLVLGPPRTNFSSTSRTPFGDSDRNDKTPHDSEFRERFQRGKMGGIGGDTETRGARTPNIRGREDAERGGEGWAKVKPRKSFGQEGAERFTGRMGGEHRQREDRGKERDEHDGVKDRRRTFDTDGEEGDAPRRNGLSRGKTEPWFKETTAKPVDPAERAMNRERIEKAKSWRTQDLEEKTSGNQGGDRSDRGDRNSERHDRRWDRERESRQEREPEWMDEPAEEKSAAHTEEEFRKFMERARGGPKTAERPADTLEGPPGLPSFFTSDPAVVQAAPAKEQRPDKFFAKFSETAAAPLGDDRSEASNVPVVKSSKFANLFKTQPAPQTIDPRGSTEPSTPAAGLQPPANGGGPSSGPQSNTQDPEFARLLSKLRMPSKPQGTPTPPNVNAYSQPPPPQPPSNQSPNVQQQQQQQQQQQHESIRNLTHPLDQKANLGSPDPPLSYGLGRPEEPRLRSVPPPGQEIMAPRPMQPPSQPPTVHHDQLLHELLAQRNNTQSQGSARSNLVADQHSAHLMQLMQQLPEQRPIEPMMRLPQRTHRQPSMQHFEPEPTLFMRDHGLPQQRQMQPPAGFENQFRRSEGDGRIMQQQQQQPVPHPHILQRQQMIPPGLDHGLPPQQPIWPGQQPLQGQRQGPMIPQPQMQPGGRAPPGLAFAMGNGPLMGGLPPNILQSNENMQGLPRGMPPPGFFGGGPPPPVGPGFMPPPGMGGPFQGPDAFFNPGPYDGRGGMPPGSAQFRR